MVDFSLVIFGCLGWVPLAVWILSLVHWMIGGDVEWTVGLCGIVVALGLGLVAFHPAVPILSPIACCVSFATVLAFPIVKVVANRQQLKTADVDMVDRAYRVLGNSPANPLAKFKLAESVYKLGLIGHGVALGDVALANLPERVASEEFRMLRRWKRMGVPPETLKPITCVECHTPCLPGWTHCRRCGAPFLLDRVRGRFLPTGFTAKLVAVWASAVVLLIGLPVASTLPIAGAVAAMPGLLVMAGAILFFAFRPRKGSPA